MRVNSHASLPTLNLPGLEHQTLAGSRDGMRSFEIWRQKIAPRAATPVHCHDCEEVITVLAGTAECHYDGKTAVIRTDESLLIPRSVVHQICNGGEDELYIMATLAMSPVQVRTADGAPMPLPWG